MEENKLYCSHCGALIGEDYEEVNGEIVCTDCFERHTTYLRPLRLSYLD